MLPQFTHPTFGGITFDAVAYGEPWDGFATPVVDRDTLEVMLDHLDGYRLHGWVDGEDVLHIEYFDGNSRPSIFDEVTPQANGTYDLGRLAWTFELAEDHPVDGAGPGLLAATAPDVGLGL